MHSHLEPWCLLCIVPPGLGLKSEILQFLKFQKDIWIMGFLRNVRWPKRSEIIDTAFLFWDNTTETLLLLFWLDDGVSRESGTLQKKKKKKKNFRHQPPHHHCSRVNIALIQINFNIPQISVSQDSFLDSSSSSLNDVQCTLMITTGAFVICHLTLTFYDRWYLDNAWHCLWQ